MEIALTRGKVAIIDDADWPLVKNYTWHAHRKKDDQWYARTAVSVPLPGGGRRLRFIQMHRLIVGSKPGEMVDHWDEDGLNNRKRNIRAATNAQNQQNTGSRGGSSRFKSVSWDTRKGKWRVAFNWDGKTYFVGNFADEIEAALAYNAAILPLAGEFARLNDVTAPNLPPNKTERLSS